MAKSKVVAKYGAQFHSIAAQAAETLTFTFETKQQAQAFRFDLYGFRRALETEGANEMYPDFARAKIRVEENKLIISPPEELPPEIIAAIEAGLKKPSGPATMMTAEPEVVWTPPPPKKDPYASFYGVTEKPKEAPAVQNTLPADFDPYEMIAATIEKELAADTSIEPVTPPPVDPFDLTETRNKIDSFTTAVNAWLAGGEEGK